MPQIHPLHAYQYNNGRGDVSRKVAPPYDVLDAAAKQSLLQTDADNIVAIDLPHVPAKELGPPAAYNAAADHLKALIDNHTVTRRDTPAIFAYIQTFDFMGQTYRRCGVACNVDTVPFGPREGGGILPHEHTFSGPKEDRLALMKATATQLSPIFGLHPDESGRATAFIQRVTESRSPDMTADLGDGVKHEVWTIDEPGDIAAYRDALDDEDIFIADGHHRYNTALNYIEWLESQGDVPADHPARQTMMVLVGMSDPGLAIGPTHRVLGGMKNYSIDKFLEASQGLLNVEAVENDPQNFDEAIEHIAARESTSVFGVMDFATGLCFCAWPAVDDPLEVQFPDKPEAWRRLDVAIIQHLIVEEICQPQLNDGEPITWAFPHAIDEVLAIGKGKETGSGGGSGFAQIAIIVKPTPLDAVRKVSQEGEVMPQKSTFFYPKLATGLFLNPLS